MPGNFSNIKVQPIILINNDVSKDYIKLCNFGLCPIEVDLPEDYLEFIKQFGQGSIDGHIYIHPIARMFNATEFWRKDNQTKAEVTFFKRRNRADCTVIGETSDGDILMYLKGLYYLSTRQYEEKVFELGPLLEDVFEFHRSHKIYGGRCDLNVFIPFDPLIRI